MKITIKEVKHKQRMLDTFTTTNYVYGRRPKRSRKTGERNLSSNFYTHMHNTVCTTADFCRDDDSARKASPPL